MIIKPDGDALAKTLRSVSPLVDEIILGINGGDGKAWDIAKDWGAAAIDIESPSKIGFDAARNKTVEKATSDWILWIDDDESLVFADKMKKYLRQNQYDAYAIHQHHYSADPAQVIKTDLPCRFFRNNKGIKFYGVVHEHPETEINEGAGNVMLLNDKECAISHDGYGTEEIRRKRFERNFPLMIKDRETYPERNLGKFLWVRDLAHMNRFEYLKTNQLSGEMFARAEEALKTWRELISSDQTRMATDCIQYVSECADLLTQGQCITFELGAGANKIGVGDDLNGSPVPTMRGRFATRQDAELYANMILKDKLDALESEYL